ncbi:MAG: hypothetical protein COT39_01635 [Parcubacteria group bacterium CG08_land_8_20_14_0_20_48_21]|nr:MAG: hypothetical protein AUK21_00045 [Parcubacteria group bacterium CG2_30_48_51]PIS32980.1 MAG: hypothetical protein COT39_01635 [Parcubacteria group bacterium CG08_land_8_20_14_0_20_48_21]PIW78907.1 MAG: hypothetical protein COZ99_03915 [Parcubacteria group bacterium CG_4_8_14_3_um_filter_48_16]PIY77721.1 MAG: hypothetical protein COY83_03665 [Parcubacteria group bacterium CG_4_10_14_0_8_um_filter_48_154]PIZ77751.1 MAG: hypothetical protein COY03_01750 [bacterium CG_4_10_14_0_2_um_filter_
MEELNELYIDDKGVVRIILRGDQTKEKAEKLFYDLLAIAQRQPEKKFNGIIDMKKFIPPSKEVEEIYKKIFSHPQVGKVAYLSEVLPYVEIFLKFFVEDIHKDTVRIVASEEQAYKWFEEK